MGKQNLEQAAGRPRLHTGVGSELDYKGETGTETVANCFRRLDQLGMGDGVTLGRMNRFFRLPDKALQDLRRQPATSDIRPEAFVRAVHDIITKYMIRKH